MSLDRGTAGASASMSDQTLSGRFPAGPTRSPQGPGHAAARRWAGLALAALAASGCGHEEKSHYESASKPQSVQVVHPEYRKIVRVIGQPSFIEAYERTSIYPKLSAYIDKWIVDIGDKVKKGDVLARLFVPELVEDFGTKKATVKLDEERIELARKVVEVADADVKAAAANLEEARSILAKYQAEADRWDTEVKRLDREVQKGVVAPQILLESTNQLKSSVASDAANRWRPSRRPTPSCSPSRRCSAKAKVDVSVAQADLGVATSDARRIEAWVGYLTLTAPFDGIISARNANTFDFVLPSTGDPTADRRSPYLSPSGSAAPIYVVDRTDIVRIFVDIPEGDANSRPDRVEGIRSWSGRIATSRSPGTVTRTSWALNVKSRTLRAEVDLTNPASELLPGMYAYTKVTIERPGVPALPLSAITHSGDNTYCWTYKDGRSERSEIRTGVNDGEWIEVTGLRRATASGDDRPWKPIDGSEQMILGDLSTLADGARVEVDPSPGGSKDAGRVPSPGTPPADPKPVALLRSP